MRKRGVNEKCENMTKKCEHMTKKCEHMTMTNSVNQ